MNTFFQNIDDLSAASQIISAFVAIVALGFAAIQINSSRRSGREAAAIEAYQKYLRGCTERPFLADWRVFQKWSGGKSPEVVCKDLEVNSETYLWFLTELLYMCDLVLRSTNDRITVTLYPLLNKTISG
jgi:hypothetical protein